MRQAAAFAWGLVALLAVPVAGAQAAKWRMVETQDEWSGAQDRRLILRAENWAAGGATLIVACGDRVPGSEGRTLLLNGGEPLHPFGGEAAAYAEVSFDTTRTAERHYWRLTDDGGARVAYIGEPEAPYFSPKVFARLLTAAIMQVRYRTLGGERIARFELRGLREQLRQLAACQWPGS